MPAIKYVKVQSLPRVDDPILNRALHTIDGELGKIARVLNNINSDNITDAEITVDDILDGETYGRIVLSALSEGLVLLSEAAGDLDDISDGTYAKMLATGISEGKALLSEALGSLDSIANGETYGRILLADLSGGHILLGTVEGDLDDVDDGTTYAKILATDISAGHILLSEAVGELPISKFANLPSDEDLVGYWSFDDGTGTVAIDGSGRGNDGALQNMEEGDWVDGKVGNALDFDGDNDWIELPTNAFGTGPVSMVFWIKTTETLERIPLTIEGAWSFKVGRGGSNNKIGVTFTGSSADMIDSTSVINDDEWHFVVATHDETTARLYIDGSEENSATQSLYNIDGLSRVSAIGGQYNGSFNINALIDEVRIYKTVLTAAEIKALYLYPAGNKGVYGMVQITDISAGHILLASCDGDLDDIDDGTYGKVLSTDISSGHILLTECSGDLDDIAEGSTYGKVALTDISAGHILLATCDGDLDDVDEGTVYGKVAITDISAGHIVLATCDGDLDDIADGSGYGKVALTSISAGKIVVAGFDDDALARIFTDSTATVNVEAWQHGLDATLIDGGKIYANSITADQILAGTITADEIEAGTITADELILGQRQYWYSIPSDTTRKNNDTERSTSSSSYVKLKQSKTYEDTGKMRIYFQLRSAGGGSVGALIYKNGIALGTARGTTNTGYQTYTEDLGGFVKDDLIQIYAKSLTDTAYVRNFRFQYDRAVSVAAGHELSTGLPTVNQTAFDIRNSPGY